MIGTKEIAQAVFDTHVMGGHSEGIKELGAGCYRTAYLAADGVVYKVGDVYENRNEVSNSRRLRRKRALAALAQFNIRIPEASLHLVKNTDNRCLCCDVDLSVTKVHHQWCEIHERPDAYERWYTRTERPRTYVTAMEYVERDSSRQFICAYNDGNGWANARPCSCDGTICKSYPVLSSLGISDYHNENVIWDGFGWALIDIAQ